MNKGRVRWFEQCWSRCWELVTGCYDYRFGVRVYDVWCFHHVLVSFELDCWRRSVLVEFWEHSMARGGVHAFAVDEVILKGSLGRVWGDASKTEECFSIMFIFSGAESVKVLDPTVMRVSLYHPSPPKSGVG